MRQDHPVRLADILRDPAVKLRDFGPVYLVAAVLGGLGAIVIGVLAAIRDGIAVGFSVAIGGLLHVAFALGAPVALLMLGALGVFLALRFRAALLGLTGYVHSPLEAEDRSWQARLGNVLAVLAVLAFVAAASALLGRLGEMSWAFEAFEQFHRLFRR